MRRRSGITPEQWPTVGPAARGALSPHVDNRDEVRASSRRRDSPTAQRREVEQARIEWAAGVAAYSHVYAESAPSPIGAATGDSRSDSRGEPTKLGADPAILLDERHATTRPALRNRNERRALRQVGGDPCIAEIEWRTARHHVRRRFRHTTRLRSWRSAAYGFGRQAGEYGRHERDAESEPRHIPSLRALSCASVSEDTPTKWCRPDSPFSRNMMSRLTPPSNLSRPPFGSGWTRLSSEPRAEDVTNRDEERHDRDAHGGDQERLDGCIQR